MIDMRSFSYLQTPGRSPPDLFDPGSRASTHSGQPTLLAGIQITKHELRMNKILKPTFRKS